MKATILECEETAEGSGIFLLEFFLWEERLKVKPGQFITLQPLNPLSVMRRPFSVYSVLSEIGDRIRILLRVVGPNTKAYAKFKPNDQIEIFGPRGNPIPLDPEVKNYILVSGGIGGAALMPSAKELGLGGKTVNFLLGVKEPRQIFGVEELKGTGCNFQVIAERDAANTGMVTDLLGEVLESDEGKSTVIACGPVMMLKKVAELAAESRNKCLVLLEEVMACGGVGSCKGCAVFGKNGTTKHVCEDGPAFDASEIDWDRMMLRYKVTPLVRIKEIPSQTENPLEITLIGQNGRILKLATPIMNAAGSLATKAIKKGDVDITHAGALITKVVTLEGLPGNDTPRVCEVAGGMLNSIGMENIGVVRFREEDLPEWLSFGLPVIVNIAGFTIDEYGEISYQLANTGVAAYEINISCPNVHGGMAFGVNPRQTSRVVKAVRESAPDKFIIVKLTPAAGIHIVDVAQAAKEAGADAISAINTLLGMAIDVCTGKPKIGWGFGGMSGPAIHPHAVKVVYDLVQADLGIPTIGIGGITNPETAAEFFMVEAKAAQIGTGLFSNPNIISDVIHGLTTILEKKHLGHIHDLSKTLDMG